MDARHLELPVTVAGADISQEVSDSLLSFEYVDKAQGEADSMTITLNNSLLKWMGPWYPPEGATITASLVGVNWFKQGESVTLDCGQFEIDGTEFSGKPHQAIIKASSILVSKPLKMQEEARDWENTTLKAIAEEVAALANLELYYDVDQEIYYERITQQRESYVGFLQRIATDAEVQIKVGGGKIILIESVKADAEPASITIDFNSKRLIKYKASSKPYTMYSGCTVSYWSEDGKHALQHTFTIPSPVQRILKVEDRVENLAQAEVLARARLRAKNRAAVGLTLDCVGWPVLRGGVNVELTGFGAFNGVHQIDEAVHSYAPNSGQPYLTTIKTRKTLDY